MPPLVKRAKKPEAPTNALFQQLKTPTGIACVVVAVTLLMVLMSVFPSDSEGSPSKSLEAFFEANHVTLRGVRILCTRSNNTCKLVARRDIGQGEPVMSIPPDAMIEHRAIMATPIGQVMGQNNASVLVKYAEESKLGMAFPTVFTFGMYLALEKLAGPSSKFYGYISALPTLEQTGGALSWDPSLDRCLDQVVAAEARGSRTMVDVAVKAAKELCEAEGVCPNGVPTEGDLKWGIATFLARNFQDQVILPGMDFARFDNSKNGLQARFNDEANVIEILAPQGARKGEELTINFLRAPATQLVATGRFDPASNGIDARIRMPDPRKDPLGKKYCIDKFGELLFAIGGRPREALVYCIGTMVATREQRKNFTKHMKTDDVLQLHVWGNLSGVVASALEGMNQGDPCTEETSEVATHMREYVSFARRVLRSNMEYIQKQYAKYSKRVPQVVADDAQGGAQDVHNAAEDAPMTP